MVFGQEKTQLLFIIINLYLNVFDLKNMPRLITFYQGHEDTHTTAF